MKRKNLSLAGIFSFLLVFMLLFAACDSVDLGGDDTSGEDNDKNNDYDDNDTLTFNNPVYVLDETDDETISLMLYAGDVLTVSSVEYIGSDGDEQTWSFNAGTINASGQLNLTIPAPPGKAMLSAEDFKALFEYNWSDVTSNNGNAGVFFLVGFLAKSDTTKYNLLRFMESDSDEKSVFEGMLYAYVDENVTFTGKGNSIIDGSYINTSKDFSLAFKKGWNPVYQKTEYTSIDSKVYQTMEITLQDPAHLKWLAIEQEEPEPDPDPEILMSGTYSGSVLGMSVTITFSGYDDHYFQLVRDEDDPPEYGVYSISGDEITFAFSGSSVTSTGTLSDDYKTITVMEEGIPIPLVLTKQE